MLLGTLVAGLLGSMLSGKGVIREKWKNTRSKWNIK